MNQREFRAWFEGFSHEMDQHPTPAEWQAIVAKVKGIDGVETDVVALKQMMEDYQRQMESHRQALRHSGSYTGGVGIGYPPVNALYGNTLYGNDLTAQSIEKHKLDMYRQMVDAATFNNMKALTTGALQGTVQSAVFAGQNPVHPPIDQHGKMYDAVSRETFDEHQRLVQMQAALLRRLAELHHRELERMKSKMYAETKKGLALEGMTSLSSYYAQGRLDWAKLAMTSSLVK